ncbi:MAG: hypothetical protein QOI66_3481, partial [Myxococcales bacterium]|nr:hypothetical protein [Myxococcales bacterium]
AKKYPAAIQELEAGYALDPRREFLFAEAQAQRLAGDCQRAVPLYQRFLATEPSALQASAAQVGLARCAQQMATATPTPPAGSAGPSPTVPPPAPPAPAPPPLQARYRDPLGGALLGAGVIGLGVGAGFLIGSLTASNNATTYDDYNRQRATIERRWNIGVVGLTSGALLTGTAIYRYHSLPTATSTSSATLIGGTVAPGYRGLLLQGQF